MSDLNQLEKRTKMIGVAAAEAMSIDPVLLSLRGPARRTDNVSWRRGIYMVCLSDVMGPNDAHDPSLHCFDWTFDWFPSQAEVDALIDEERRCVDTSHRIVNVHQSVKDPDPHYGKPVDGRHFILATRIANVLTAAEGFKPGVIRFGRRDYSPAEAKMLADMLNRGRRRDPALVIKQRVEIIEGMCWNDKQAAAHFEVAESTIRNWRNRAAERKTKTGRKRETHRVTAARAEVVLTKLASLNETSSVILAKDLIAGMVTGELSERAPAWLREAWGVR